MAKLGSKAKPARIRVQTEERAVEMIALCNKNGWQVIAGIEPDKPENIDDIEELQKPSKSGFSVFKTIISKNAPCPCGSGKLYKRCCMA